MGNFFKKIAIFSSFSDDDLDYLEKITEEIKLPAGTELFTEESNGDTAYIIKTGQIDILKQLAGGNVLLATRRSGEVIGEMALLGNVPRMATARVKVDSVLITISQKQFDQLLDSNPSVVRAILRTMIHPRWKATEVMLQKSEQAVQEQANKLEQTLAALTIRTKQLEKTNIQLQQEIAERIKTEEKLRQAKEEAEIASQAKNQFLANISHELRTPLNGILGYAQILKRNMMLTKEQKKGLDIIEHSGNHLLTLINDTLDVAKIEAGKIELYETDVHLPNLLEHINEIMYIKAEHKGINYFYYFFNFQQSLPASQTPSSNLNELPLGVYCDEKRLQQVLINLLENAIKFTHYGKVTFKVGLIPTKPIKTSNIPSVTIRFQIEDTGVGISEKEMHTIFQPFEQGGDRNQRIQGTGLGLAISYDLISLMGGELKVQSKLGEGSTFWFDLTLPNVSDHIKKPVIPLQQIVGFEEESLTILIVDDKPQNCNILVDLLTPLGFRTLEANNGNEALAKAIEFLPEVIITDLVMPEMDGFELIRQIGQNPLLQQTIIITTSASVLEKDYKKSFAVGSKAFIPKPIQANLLFETLQKHLNIKWRYKEINKLFTNNNKIDPAQLAIPSPEWLGPIFELAMMGDIGAVEIEATKLFETNKQFELFASELMRLTQSFQIDKLCNWLEELLSNTTKIS